jgi:TolA-binding protein
MITIDCRNELVQRERRGQLSNSERLTLDAHVKFCDACRLTRLIGHDFDQWNVVGNADGERLERMMQSSERWVNRPRRLVRPLRARWLLAAMATTLAAAATTVAVTSQRRNHPPSAEGTTASAASVAERTRREHPAPAQDVDTAAPRPAEANPTHIATSTSERSIERVASATAASQERVGSNATAVVLSAEQLLQKANQARRSGDAKEAIRLFRRLQRDYPSSREAGLSLVALGTLLLERGQATLALEQFNRYLASAGAALTAEALYGKGQTLARLGLVAEEQQNWQRLLAKFPKSPYATHAKRRLAGAR